MRSEGYRRCCALSRISLAVTLSLAWLVSACSSSRHVPQGQYLLDKVKVDVSRDSTGTFTSEEMINYVRQLPNHKILWSMKLQLGVYNMSGRDTTKWWNRWIRRIGEAPVIYDPELALASRQQLQKALVNKGFLDAEVDMEVRQNERKRKAEVDYILVPGQPHIIDSISYVFPNDELHDAVMEDSAHFAIRRGDFLDRSLLDTQRDVIAGHLKNKGYYAFTKEFIRLNADTTAGSKLVDLTVTIEPPYDAQHASAPQIDTHIPYTIRSIRVITDYKAMDADRLDKIAAVDTVDYKDMVILYGKSHYLRPSVIYDNCHFRVGMPYRQADVDQTYEAFSRLNILKFTNIRFIPAEDETGEVDAYILLTRDKSQSVAFELEGTNSEGDLGVAASVTYTHRNVGKGSETLTAKVRGAYESISGDLNGLLHDRYMEYSFETDINFPKFKFPLLDDAFKRKIKASTQFSLSFNYQERPEYTRIIATAGWSYRWAERNSRKRHIFTPIDINYVFLPESTSDFLDQIAPDNPLLRYSYENHFIMRMGYSFYYTDKRTPRPWDRGLQRNINTFRANAEIAGNLMFGISSIFSHRDFHSDPYKVFGIHYSQYLRLEGDYSFLHQFDVRNSLALHVGMGVGIPYGNSSILPFEKRFYGGGANGVRGWDVRTLGPGSYPGSNSVSDFINQCGDIRLDLNAEYRAKLFWVLEMGLFIDAGNIWTIRNYEAQPGGVFRFGSFYKQLAAAYGIGIRMDFDYFLIRFDLGMKAHNPASGAEPWPLLHPKWGRDNSFHFSIGYPF